jgi:hypothetical protein
MVRLHTPRWGASGSGPRRSPGLGPSSRPSTRSSSRAIDTSIPRHRGGPRSIANEIHIKEFDWSAWRISVLLAGDDGMALILRPSSAVKLGAARSRPPASRLGSWTSTRLDARRIPVHRSPARPPRRQGRRRARGREAGCAVAAIAPAIGRSPASPASWLPPRPRRWQVGAGDGVEPRSSGTRACGGWPSRHRCQSSRGSVSDLILPGRSGLTPSGVVSATTGLHGKAAVSRAAR